MSDYPSYQARRRFFFCVLPHNYERNAIYFLKNAGSFVIVKLYTNMVNPRAAEFPPERKLEKFLTMAPEGCKVPQELRQLAMGDEFSPGPAAGGIQ